jgi:anti-anti-sigma factor
MTDGLSVDQQPDGVIVLSGELSLAEAATLEGRLSAVLEATEQQLIVIDLAGVGFIDSTGLGVLIRSQQAADRRGIVLAVRNPAPQAQRLLTLTGLDEQLTAPARAGADQDSAGRR